MGSAIWVRAAFPHSVKGQSVKGQLMRQINRELSVVNPDACGIDLGAEYH